MRIEYSWENDVEGMVRHQWFCRCSNRFRRNLNNCQMPRGAAGSLGSNLGCTFFGCRPISRLPLVYALSLLLSSLDVFLSPTISKSICLSRWRAHTARRRLSIPFNLACKCRLNIFRRPTKAPRPVRALFPVTISLSGGIKGGTKPQLWSWRRARRMYFYVSTWERNARALPSLGISISASERASEWTNEILM